MRRYRLILALIVLALCASELAAQFYPGPVIVPGVPVLAPHGFGFHHRGRRHHASGFFNTGYSVGVVPARGFYPGPYGPIAPVYSIPTVGYIDTRVTYQVIAPTVVLSPRPLPGFSPDGMDLSGVDLDSSPSPLLIEERKGKARIEVPVLKRIDDAPKPILPKPKKAKPVEEPPSFLEQGTTAFRAGEFGLALLHFRQAAAAEPKSGRPLFLLAHAYIAQGKLHDAVAAIHEGLKIEPNFPLKPFRPKAELFKGIEDEYDRERKLLSDLVLEHPKNGAFHFLHGYLDWFEGNRGPARKTFAIARPLLAETWFIDRFLKAPEELVLAP